MGSWELPHARDLGRLVRQVLLVRVAAAQPVILLHLQLVGFFFITIADVCLYTDLTLISFNVLWHQLICLILPADRVTVPKKNPKNTDIFDNLLVRAT